MHGAGEEINGLKKALDGFIRKKNALLEALSATYNESKKFGLGGEIKELEAQIESLRQQIARLETGNPAAAPVTFPEDVYTSRLPDTNARLFGRDNELALLAAAWNDTGCNIVEFIAWGGVGKTALLRTWLDGMAADGYRGAWRVYAWSFYSQGAGDHRQSTAELFIIDMLKWYGHDPLQLPKDPIERARMLVKEIRAKRTLLLLDGLEPLQYPPGELEGQLKDLGLRALLKELASYNPGLCLITSRIKVKAIEGSVGRTVRHVPLESLTPEAGAHLLKHLGVKGKTEELQAVSAEFKGHALALRLLGNYLAIFHAGDLRQRDRIKKLNIEEKHGGHARRVMEAYVHWFEQDNRYLPDLTLLYLIGLFDRPAPSGALAALLEKPELEPITAPFKNLTSEQQTLCWKHLESQSLLRATPTRTSVHRTLSAEALRDGGSSYTSGHLPGLDAHPLVREFFAEKFQAIHPQAWQAAHAALYEYYKNLPEKNLPDTLEEMEPLFQAVAHGCRAGLEQQALDEVFWERISRKKDYPVRQLGAIGSSLTTLSWFFNRCWDLPAENISVSDKAFLLSCAGFCLRAMGRLAEAAEPMCVALNLFKVAENWLDAAINTSNLSELYLIRGSMAAALDYGRQGVDYANRSEDGFQMESKRTTLAEALFQAGHTEEAANLFAESERMQQERQKKYPYLYSLRGFQYNELLLSLGQYKEVLGRAKQTLEWAYQHNLGLLTFALDKLSIGKAYYHLYQKESSQEYQQQATDYLQQAVAGLRKAGQQDHLPRALLARAAWHRLQGQYEAAREDLAETLDIAEAGGMRLHLADYHLESARLAQAVLLSHWATADSAPPSLKLRQTEGKAREHIESARKLIEETSYHRRDKELRELMAET